MPIPALTALGFTNAEDSSKYIETPIDPVLAKETEGGLIITRRRFTRNPGMDISFAYTDLNDTDKQILDAFYKSVFGGVEAFIYTHPITDISILVRFKSPYSAQYIGLGGYHRWDVANVNLRTV